MRKKPLCPLAWHQDWTSRRLLARIFGLVRGFQMPINLTPWSPKIPPPSSTVILVLASKLVKSRCKIVPLRLLVTSLSMSGAHEARPLLKRRPTPLPIRGRQSAIEVGVSDAVRGRYATRRQLELTTGPRASSPDRGRETVGTRARDAGRQSAMRSED